MRTNMKSLSFFEWTAIWVAAIAICLALASKTHQYLPHEEASCADAVAVESHLQDLLFRVPSAEIATGQVIRAATRIPALGRCGPRQITVL